MADMRDIDVDDEGLDDFICPPNVEPEERQYVDIHLMSGQIYS